MKTPEPKFDIHDDVMTPKGHGTVVQWKIYDGFLSRIFGYAGLIEYDVLVGGHWNTFSQEELSLLKKW